MSWKDHSGCQAEDGWERAGLGADQGGQGKMRLGEKKSLDQSRAVGREKRGQNGDSRKAEKTENKEGLHRVSNKLHNKC